MDAKREREFQDTWPNRLVAEHIAEFKTDVHSKYALYAPAVRRRWGEYRIRLGTVEWEWRRWIGLAVFAVLMGAFISVAAAWSEARAQSGPSSEILLQCPSCPVQSVTKIVDGDTIHTNVGKIRIYGADTPEIDERCYSEATTAMSSLAGQRVRAERGPREYDVYGRHLFYLYTDSGFSIDEFLVREGYAVAWRSDGQHRDMLVAAEAEAKRENVGCLWSGSG